MTAESKPCSKCKIVKPLSEFWTNRQQKSGLQPHCKDCHRKDQPRWKEGKSRGGKSWYQQNKEEHKRKTYERVARNKKLIDDLKNKPCSICGGCFHPAAMDWHHRNGSDKIKGIGEMRGWSQEKILAEISKCDLVCSNCHRTLHAKHG